MRVFYSLCLVAGLASCGAPSNYTPGAGFDGLTISGQATSGTAATHTPAATAAMATPQSGVQQTQDHTAPPQYSADTTRQINSAMEASFGHGTARDGRVVNVAGSDMSLRVVNVRGYSFAVLVRTGINWGGTTGREMFPQMIQAAQAHSGCTPSGKVSLQRHANGAHTRYSVHLNC